MFCTSLIPYFGSAEERSPQSGNLGVLHQCYGDLEAKIREQSPRRLRFSAVELWPPRFWHTVVSIRLRNPAVGTYF